MPDADPFNAPPPPLDYLSYAHPAPPRSSIPRVLGILGLIYGILGLIVRAFSLALTLSIHAKGVAYPYSRDVYRLDLAMNCTFLALGLLLIVGASGLLAYRGWGLKLTTLWAVASIPLLLLFLGLYLAVVAPTFRPAGTPSPAEIDAQRVGFYGGLIGVMLVRVAVPVAFLILLRRRPARDSVS